MSSERWRRNSVSAEEMPTDRTRWSALVSAGDRETKPDISLVGGMTGEQANYGLSEEQCREAIRAYGEAADRAVSLHGARQPASRRCPVVLDPYVAASFASVIGGTLSADAVQRGRSLFAGKEGERIADRRLRLVDDGLVPDGLATAPFDGEGIPQQRTPIISTSSP